MIESRYEDNLLLYDRKRGEWTERGRAYIAVLDRLTGVRHLRLRKGLWSRRGHHLRRVGSYGSRGNRFNTSGLAALLRSTLLTNPFVWQAWQRTRRRLYRYREIHKTGGRWRSTHRRSGVCADEPRPAGRHRDHDAEDRATFTLETNMSTVAAIKMVSPGIQAVKERPVCG